MQKREHSSQKVQPHLKKTKMVENQIFDMDVNLLTSARNSFTQSVGGSLVRNRFKDNS